MNLTFISWEEQVLPADLSKQGKALGASDTTMSIITLVGAAAGAVGAVLLTPVAISAAGFTAGGIAAGSLASWLMSITATASGGGVVAGGFLATLQSIGAAGFSGAATAVVASVGGAVGGAVTNVMSWFVES